MDWSFDCKQGQLTCKQGPEAQCRVKGVNPKNAVSDLCNLEADNQATAFIAASDAVLA